LNVTKRPFSEKPSKEVKTEKVFRLNSIKRTSL
jgi:hypothetical protein